MMVGSVSEDSGVGRSSDGILSRERCQSGESLSEWRSCEQLENGSPSTSPPLWDIDDDDDDCGAKPSELYGKFTWKIENFSQISKRELKSNAFEVGGYKWYILIYPHGCDVCNHLSLFLCVANYDKLLPGWSHFAQFTIAVVNKDPKKSKYSDTLHRFWKKEHDWGWKKFMELSKIYDGFVVSDTLVIKAQVQVIREKSHRPFRCLDCQYRRELVRVYLSNVELNFRRFVEEKRGMFGNLIEDKLRWSSFRAFWFGVDQIMKRHLSRDKTDNILKNVVKKFFIEKEVTSTLVMDSLYSGLKALEGQSKNKKGMNFMEMEETPAPIVFVERDMFVLADDVLLLLERATFEPLPPKDDKGPQNRTKDGSSSDDINKDSIERDERRLTELGRRTVEVFVIAHIFSSKIEAAYQEAVAFKRQEELIREEEAAGQVENELKTKRGASEKEKRAKKKRAKQKRRSRKEKAKGRDVKFDVIVQEKDRQMSPSENMTLMEFSFEQNLSVGKSNTLEDVSDISDVGDDTETLRHDLEDIDDGTLNWDADASEVHPAAEVSSFASSLPMSNGEIEKKSPFVVDDSSSTCSTDSAPSVVFSGSSKGNSFTHNKSQASPIRGNNLLKQTSRDQSRGNGTSSHLSDLPSDVGSLNDSAPSCRGDAPESDSVVLSLKDRIHWFEQHLVEKEVVTLQKKLTKDQTIGDRHSKRSTGVLSSPSSPTENLSSISQPKIAVFENAVADTPVASQEAFSNSPSKTVPSSTRAPQLPLYSRPEVPKPTALAKESLEKSMTHQGSLMSRPSSAPVTPAPRVNTPVISMVQASLLLSRSMSAAGRLGTESSSSAQAYVPLSYKSAITGKNVAATSATFAPRPVSIASSPSPYAQVSSTLSSLPMHSPVVAARKEQTSVQPGSGIPVHILQNQSHLTKCSQQEGNRVMTHDSYNLNGKHGPSIFRQVNCEQQISYTNKDRIRVPQRQVQCPPDDFPHLDIINYLFDEELDIGKGAKSNGGFHNRHLPLNRQFTIPGDMYTADVSSSANGFRFNRSRRLLDDGFGRTYGSSNRACDVMRDANVQFGLSTFMNNGQIDGMFHNQWQALGPDLSLFGMRNAESDGHPFPLPDHTNLACGVNGYSVFRPASGH